jgi:acetyl-CoA C-acetyltransferase
MPHPATVILSAVRTPLGAFQGALASLPATRLGACAIKAAVERAGATADEVSDVFMGHVLQAGTGQAPARQAALYAGLSSSTRCATINKVCGSGLESIVLAHRAIALGETRLAVAGGMESMSSAPYLLPKIREGYRLGHRQMLDALVHDGLWDPHQQQHMGSCAERCAAHYGFTREQQDSYAAESFRRANAAQKEGRFCDEIVGVEFTEAKAKPLPVTQDEGPARVNYDKIPTLRPAFEENGTITAANASTLNDGAAALVLADSDHAAAHGLTPLARLVGHGSFSHDPLWFTTAPVDAARAALTMAGWQPSDVDLWEVNEAFAVVPLAFARELNVPADRLNVRGGAISLGHPIGASGARIVVTLLSALRQRGVKRGVAAICIGGGEGLALCVELV